MTAVDSRCPACAGPARFPLRFCQPCRDSGADDRWRAAHPPPPREHAPGHRIWTQAGPHGMHSQGCYVDSCDWHVTVGGRS